MSNYYNMTDYYNRGETNCNCTCTCNTQCACTTSSLPKWDTIPYYNETNLPKGVDPTAGQWPLEFFNRNSVGKFYDFKNQLIPFQLKDPSLINYEAELKELVNMQNDLNAGGNPKYIEIAKFWGTGVPINQWVPIALQLITSYKVTPPKSARIMRILQGMVNDAFVITWYYKYLYNVPRACQLDHNLKTVLDTPRFPSYPSGHSVVSGACEVLLSYYFPMEAEKLHKLAQDASISRLYGGIHCRSDLTEGLELGRQIAAVVVKTIKLDYDQQGNPVDYIYQNYMDAPIMPPYYK